MQYVGFVGFFWIIFLIVWAFSAIRMKKTRHWSIWRGMGIRIVLVCLILIIFRSHFLNRFSLEDLIQSKAVNPFLGFLGVLLCAIGIGFAIWARVHIGKNWGTPMSIKEEPELVTSGPYAYVKHPIYSGVILAMIGSALAINMTLLIPFAVFCIYFFYSAKTEEKNMTKIFPTAYPEYSKKTKMFVPFLF